MMQEIAGFYPVQAGTVNIAATTSSAHVQIASAFGGKQRVRVTNSGTTTAFVEFGSTSSVTASTTASMPVLGGTSVLVNTGEEYAAAIMGTGTGTIYFTPGTGGAGP